MAFPSVSLQQCPLLATTDLCLPQIPCLVFYFQVKMENGIAKGKKIHTPLCRVIFFLFVYIVYRMTCETTSYLIRMSFLCTCKTYLLKVPQHWNIKYFSVTFVNLFTMIRYAHLYVATKLKSGENGFRLK